MSTSSAAGSPAKTSPSLEEGQGWMGDAPAFGGGTRGPFATFDLATSSWRTWQHSLFGGSEPFSANWPRWGSMRSGTASPRQPSVPLTAVTGSSYLPTPTASDTGGYNQSPSPGAA